MFPIRSYPILPPPPPPAWFNSTSSSSSLLHHHLMQQRHSAWLSSLCFPAPIVDKPMDLSAVPKTVKLTIIDGDRPVHIELCHTPADMEPTLIALTSDQQQAQVPTGITLISCSFNDHRYHAVFCSKKDGFVDGNCVDAPLPVTSSNTTWTRLCSSTCNGNFNAHSRQFTTKVNFGDEIVVDNNSSGRIGVSTSKKQKRIKLEVMVSKKKTKIEPPPPIIEASTIVESSSTTTTMFDAASVADQQGYQCDRCGKMFSYSYYRDKHLKYTRCVDHGDRKFPCHLCSRSFEKRDRLRIHILHVHENHRPHTCAVCGKCFSQSSSLNKHLRVHSGERPYKCSFCPKSFTASSILRTHIRQHSGERPFKCKHCGKSFASHAAHDSHVRRTHPTTPASSTTDDSIMVTDGASVKCVHCKKCFQHNSHLNFHIQCMHHSLLARE